VNAAPIPYAGRLLRCVRRQLEHAEHARILAQLAGETNGDVEAVRKSRHTAVDAIAARGVPLVGPGCAGGVIRGTQPEQAVVANLSR
jgi:hypothetical protein